MKKGLEKASNLRRWSIRYTVTPDGSYSSTSLMAASNFFLPMSMTSRYLLGESDKPELVPAVLAVVEACCML